MFLSCPFITTRVHPFLFLLFGLNPGTPKQKGLKGTTQEPRLGIQWITIP